MFSTRTRWDVSANELSIAVEERRRAGLPIIDLTESNPTAVGLPYPGEAIVEALADPAWLRYSPEPLGLLCAREAVSAWYAGRGTTVSPERIALTASTSESYAHLFKLLCEPGDEILVPQPSYPLFEYLATLEAVNVRGYPLQFDGGWYLEPEALAEAIGPRTRAIVVVHPGNPNGAFFKKDEARSLEALCARHDLALIADEVFATFPFGPDALRQPSFLQCTGALTFVLSGLSKAAGLPQLKLGWMAVNGPEPLVREALARLEIVNDTFLSANTPVQHALGKLLALTATVQQAIQARTRANVEALRSMQGSGSAWEGLNAEGGWSAVLRVSQARSEQEWALTLLQDDGVLVHPGFFFDFPREGHLVVSLLPEAPRFEEAMRRIAARLDQV